MLLFNYFIMGIYYGVIFIGFLSCVSAFLVLVLFIFKSKRFFSYEIKYSHNSLKDD